MRNKILRKRFTERNDEDLVPDLIALQKDSYNRFIGSNDLEEQKSSGIYQVFKSIFPLKNNNESLVFEFLSYDFDEPKFSDKESLYYDKTFAMQLHATFRLFIHEVNENNEKGKLRTIKDQRIYLCDLPVMTDRGSFIYSGIERIIITQLIKSPGIVFDVKNNIYEARIIPMDGSWLSFEFDNLKEHIFFKLDGKKKLTIISLLLALNLNREQILGSFYPVLNATIKNGKVGVGFDINYLTDKKLTYDLVDFDTNKILIERKTKLLSRILEKNKGTKKYLIDDKNCEKFVLADDIEELKIRSGQQLTPEIIKKIQSANITSVKVVNPYESELGDYIYRIFKENGEETRESALFKIYENVRNGERAQTVEQADKFINRFLFDINLSSIGRMKINKRLNLDIEEEKLTIKDIIEIIKVLSRMKHNKEPSDDVDSLQNRRARLVGETLQNQFTSSLRRIRISILEKLNVIGLNYDALSPIQVVNFKSLMSSINDLFATSQLSQFMDQTNPLSELSHKRRVTLLGVGGLKRDRAISDVRDIHYTQYGKLCPVETPEGQNVGLVNNFALMSKVDDYGFVTTPYKRVKNGVIQNEIIYLSSLEEIGEVIASSNVGVAPDGKIVDKSVFCRCDADFEYRDVSEVTLIEVSARQILSVAANLIPFIGNDHSNRCLMASAMLRQSVPLMNAEFPLVGTGIESRIAKDTGVLVRAKKDGIVKSVDSTKIVVETHQDNSLPEINVYKIDKFKKTNADTVNNQHPTVEVGQKVMEGDIMSDAQSIRSNELSLGRNVLVAFMPWDGYNFSDSIVISDRLLQNGDFDSIHIEEYEIVARDTQLGPEEITRFVPNVSEEALRKLDESGIVHIGAEIKVGDILVGKITPKMETPTTPEEKLLKTIFGEKSNEVKDTSLYVTPGTLEGVVIDVKVFVRQGLEKDERATHIEDLQIQKLLEQKNETLSLIRDNVNSQISVLVEGKILTKQVRNLKKGEKLTKTNLKTLKDTDFVEVEIDDKEVQTKILNFKRLLKEKMESLDRKFKDEILKIKENSDLGQSVLKVVKVLIASKQRLQPGDKMVGRHGNKGVVSKILPVADMPYTKDGTPVDILLTPSGVPSRMNIGQI
ncbi:MAG: DNA-directed RNA polymerase subunit beta, partial [Rickettsiales bacterium]|nr:DNA-directed RNA polymerase subunit beta [Rickettsiales bacterium]